MNILRYTIDKFKNYNDKLNLKQFIFVYMQFDGKALTFKEVAIDKVDFTNSGQLKKKGKEKRCS